MFIQKISDLPRDKNCVSLLHNPPKHIANETGVYEWKCPDCGSVARFVVRECDIEHLQELEAAYIKIENLQNDLDYANSELEIARIEKMYKQAERNREPSVIKEGGYQGSSDPGRPTQLMQQQTLHARLCR